MRVAFLLEFVVTRALEPHKAIASCSKVNQGKISFDGAGLLRVGRAATSRANAELDAAQAAVADRVLTGDLLMTWKRRLWYASNGLDVGPLIQVGITGALKASEQDRQRAPVQRQAQWNRRLRVQP
jgi:hypothetical protein